MLGFMRSRAEPERPQTHDVAGRTLPLAIVENPRAKRLTLRIQPGDRGLKVTIPPGMAQIEIDRFLARHETWLAERVEKMPDRPHVRPGIKLPIKGVKHTIFHQPGRGVTTARVGTDGPELLVRGMPEHLPRRVADYLKRQAKTEIEPLVTKHAAAIGKSAKSIRYKDTISRWGSCSSAGNLSFSWRIAMAPPPVINYLVAHEVAHLKHMHHGSKFWALCEELCPDTKRCKDWLRRNGSKLQSIVF